MEIRKCVPELSYTTTNSAYGTDWWKGEYLRKSFTQSTPYKGLLAAVTVNANRHISDHTANRKVHLVVLLVDCHVVAC